MANVACVRVDGGAGVGPRSSRYGRVQWKLSVAAHAAGGADTGGFNVLDMVSDGGGAEGCTIKVRTGIVARTVAGEYWQTPARLIQ